MDRRLWIKGLALSAPPILLWLWLLIPALQPKIQTVTGHARPSEACLLWCSPVVAIGDVSLSCKADFLGVPYACPSRLLKEGPASASFFKLPTLGGILGFAPTSGVLLQLEREGQVVFRRSVRGQVLATIYGGWVFHAVYWPIVGLIIWRWPDSRISRRAQWLSIK